MFPLLILGSAMVVLFTVLVGVAHLVVEAWRGRDDEIVISDLEERETAT